MVQFREIAQISSQLANIARNISRAKPNNIKILTKAHRRSKAVRDALHLHSVARLRYGAEGFRAQLGV